MPVPSAVLWDADPHTLAKHRLLKDYLAAWLPTPRASPAARTDQAHPRHRGGAAPVIRPALPQAHLPRPAQAPPHPAGHRRSHHPRHNGSAHAHAIPQIVARYQIPRIVIADAYTRNPQHRADIAASLAKVRSLCTRLGLTKAPYRVLWQVMRLDAPATPPNRTEHHV
jgi:hypothetical protein